VPNRDSTPRIDRSHSVRLDAAKTDGKKAIVESSGILVKMI
jgi:hypothetical protein